MRHCGSHESRLLLRHSRGNKLGNNISSFSIHSLITILEAFNSSPFLTAATKFDRKCCNDFEAEGAVSRHFCDIGLQKNYIRAEKREKNTGNNCTYFTLCWLRRRRFTMKLECYRNCCGSPIFGCHLEIEKICYCSRRFRSKNKYIIF